MPVCKRCNKQYDNLCLHELGTDCRKAPLVKVEAEKNNNKWRIVSTKAETVAGERIYALQAWFWDGCPVRATETWHVLASGTSFEALEEIAKKEWLLQSNNKV
jgi:hypothetical protein